MDIKEKEMPMYARGDIGSRIFAANKEQWIEAAAKDYRSKEESAVQSVERGIILPLQQASGANSFTGGVFDEGFSFIAASSRLWMARADAHLQKARCVEAVKELDGGIYR